MILHPMSAVLKLSVPPTKCCSRAVRARKACGSNDRRMTSRGSSRSRRCKTSNTSTGSASGDCNVNKAPTILSPNVSRRCSRGSLLASSPLSMSKGVTPCCFSSSVQPCTHLASVPSSCPRRISTCSGVMPSRPEMSGHAPLSSKALSTSTGALELTAATKVVQPSPLAAIRSTPCWRKRCTLDRSHSEPFETSRKRPAVAIMTSSSAVIFQTCRAGTRPGAWPSLHETKKQLPGRSVSVA
mmetsp:Transcript_68965/g.150064  ORF Transcript_68965/g.150064 Transcript_68965/m.150064 type:complete len:241 (+) Transcript_68965:31-753(+)